jgi:hypothetical protein
MYNEELQDLHEINRLLEQMRQSLADQAAALAELRADLLRERSRITSLTYWAN